MLKWGILVCKLNYLRFYWCRSWLYSRLQAMFIITLSRSFLLHVFDIMKENSFNGRSTVAAPSEALVLTSNTETVAQQSTRHMVGCPRCCVVLPCIGRGRVTTDRYPHQTSPTKFWKKSRKPDKKFSRDVAVYMGLYSAYVIKAVVETVNSLQNICGYNES